jgi:hypothetical protein
MSPFYKVSDFGYFGCLLYYAFSVTRLHSIHERVNDAEQPGTNIHALSSIRTHGLCAQAIEACLGARGHWDRQTTHGLWPQQSSKLNQTDRQITGDLCCRRAPQPGISGYDIRNS